MMKTNVTTHIFARAAKANLAGEFPIYIRITIDGKRSEFSTRKFIHPKKWDQRTMRVKGSTEEARTLNSYLDAMQNKITQTQVHFQYLDSPVTVDHFVATLLGRKTERERTIMPIFQDHNQRMHALLHVEFNQKIPFISTYINEKTAIKWCKKVTIIRCETTARILRN